MKKQPNMWVNICRPYCWRIYIKYRETEWQREKDNLKVRRELTRLFLKPTCNHPTGIWKQTKTKNKYNSLSHQLPWEYRSKKTQLSLVRMSTVPKKKREERMERMGEGNPWRQCHGIALFQSSHKTVCRFIKRMKTQLSCVPAIPFLSTHPNKMQYVFPWHICIPIFIATLFNEYININDKENLTHIWTNMNFFRLKKESMPFAITWTNTDSVIMK